MKKRNAKKGFTIVELVIVIAVIAILSAVLIPTFGGIVNNAKESAAMQEARNLYTTYLAGEAGKGNVDEDLYVKLEKGGYVQVEDGAVKPQADGKYIVATITEADVDLLKAADTEAGYAYTLHTHKDSAADGKCDICTEDMPA